MVDLVVVQEVRRRFLERHPANLWVDRDALFDVALTIAQHPARDRFLLRARAFANGAPVLVVLDPDRRQLAVDRFPLVVGPDLLFASIETARSLFPFTARSRNTGCSQIFNDIVITLY